MILSLDFSKEQNISDDLLDPNDDYYFNAHSNLKGNIQY